MTQGTDVIADVVLALEALDIPYMIGGSVALAVWATPRTTHDLDVVVDLDESRIAQFCARFPVDRYYLDSDAMRDAFRQSGEPGLGMYSFLDTETGLKVDLFPLRRGDPAQQMALQRRTRVEVLSGVEAYVYAPDDLLVQKLRWYAVSESERQFRDCLNLLLTDSRRATPLIAEAYVGQWAQEFGLAVQTAWEALKLAAQKTRADH